MTPACFPSCSSIRFFVIACGALLGVGSAQKPPKVVRLQPAHGSVEVDATKTDELVVEFDVPMRRGRSFCGGGPNFPKVLAITWRDDRTCVMRVALEADHSYRMSLNCRAAQNFVSKAGRRLSPTPWSFATLPLKLLSPAEQRQSNASAFAALQGLLESRYSYFEHRKLDWPALYHKHRPAILGARTARGWAVQVGQMLEPTGDLHLYLRIGETTIATGRRAVDPLYRAQRLGDLVSGLRQPIKGVLTGRTDSGIEYLMISSWTKRIDFDAVDELLGKLVDAKALVIDVRPNSGGSENLARRVAQWFVDGDKIYAKHVVRTGKGDKGFKPVYSRRIRGKRRFRGPVAVLMSRYCMSSCEAFLLMMKQADDCTLIGQSSYGSSGNPQRHRLPNGVEIFIPCWKAMRPDGSCFEGEGVRPHLEVKATSDDLRDRDPILERAIAHLGVVLEKPGQKK